MTIEIDNFRSKYPEYDDVADIDLSRMLAKQYPDAYGDLPEKLEAEINVSAQLAEQKDRYDKIRQEAFQELAQDVGPLESFLIGAGKGLYTLGRGAGIADPATPAEQEGINALRMERPISMAIGEATGEAAPFLLPGAAVTKIPTTIGRIAGSAALGGTSGGLISKGYGEDAASGAAIGAGLEVGADLLFPVVGRLGRKIFQSVTGRAPKGAILDSSGFPTEEFQEALNTAGIEFDDLKRDATEFLTRERIGSDPDQVTRRLLFREEGIPATRGEIRKEAEQIVSEQRLLQSPGEAASEPFRQFKLRQSEAIKENLGSVFKRDVTQEETGQIIQDALLGRKDLLTTQKNELYKKVADEAENISDMPVFTNALSEAIPDDTTLQRLEILDATGSKQLNDWLTRFGVKEPTDELIDAGFEVEPLTMGNFELFRQGLNQISKSSDAIKIATGPVTRALDTELDEIASAVPGGKIPKEILSNLKKARSTVRTLKTEFSPQSIIGRITDVKNDGVTAITEASKVYSKMATKSMPVENTRKLIKSLNKSGEKGKEAIASLQASTLLDLMDAGFGTESRRISGIKTFNPIAFKRRLKTIGRDKVNAIFSNNREVLKKIGNIDKIASELIPPDALVPKGSSATILDLSQKLGLATIASKVPGGALFLGSIESIASPVKKSAEIRRALKTDPEIINTANFIGSRYPGLAAGLGVPAFLSEYNQEQQR